MLSQESDLGGKWLLVAGLPVAVLLGMYFEVIWDSCMHFWRGVSIRTRRMKAGNSLPQPLLSDFSGEEPTGTLAECHSQSDASASQNQIAQMEMQALCTEQDGYYLRLAE